MEQQEGLLPEIFIIPAGERLWTITWKLGSLKIDTREALRADAAYKLVWYLNLGGYNIHNHDDYAELEKATISLFAGGVHAAMKLRSAALDKRYQEEREQLEKQQQQEIIEFENQWKEKED